MVELSRETGVMESFFGPSFFIRSWEKSLSFVVKFSGSSLPFLKSSLSIVLSDIFELYSDFLFTFYSVKSRRGSEFRLINNVISLIKIRKVR